MLQNIELEQSILACMLIDRDCAMDSGLLSSVDFVVPANREIFNSIKRLTQADKQIDYMTVYQDLNQEIPLSHLTTLSESMPTVRNFQEYVKQLKDITLKRNLYKLSEKMKDKDRTGKEIAEIAEKEIFEMQEDITTGEITQVRDIVLSTVDEIQEMYYGNKPSGIMTGYRAVDALLNGLKKGQLIIVAARPAMGKTSYAMNIAENLILQDKSVAFFSLEMTKQELTEKLILSSALVGNDKLRKKTMTDYDWEKVSNATNAILQTNLFIDDNSTRTVSEMHSMSRRLKRRKGLDLVVVDYLQLMTTKNNSENRQQEISTISRGLKIMAKSLNIPVIALSQLSRACEMRQDKRPLLSDLRESGSIEQDADVVKFIYRDEYYNPDTDLPGIAEILVAKNRKGPTGKAELGWIGEFTKFLDIDKLERRR
ncbi:replicative DNA helicase [Anaerosalibacter massiliensis]|uniref:replicative DNA helicase n=1 Tax=Anaerosalibacter massiliensis TaxID=1347392 RepID=UPI0005B25F09|nr:replicative DNA helicase [Anaerosalibacter massiliensis]